MKIIYGTGNQGKLNQVRDFLKYKQMDVEILSLKDIEFKDEIEETGETFEENSLIKAMAIKKYCDTNGIKEIIITDDAGLCVDALDGKPGVYSARFAGKNASQQENLDLLLNKLKDVKDPNRTAKFGCVLTVIMPDGEKLVCRGETRGKIAQNYSKLEKLTYSPVFIPEGFEKTMNELSPEELGDTHREKALMELIRQLKNKNV